MVSTQTHFSVDFPSVRAIPAEVDCLRESCEVQGLGRGGAVLPAAAPPRGRPALQPDRGGREELVLRCVLQSDDLNSYTHCAYILQ